MCFQVLTFKCCLSTKNYKTMGMIFKQRAVVNLKFLEQENVINKRSFALVKIIQLTY